MNTSGVPSIVYGVFGLGFFVYFLGGSLDQLFYAPALPSPTFGTPGLLWASLTLALLTLPVVIVATEEGLSRIPRSVREGSLALGATKYETLMRVVIPMASPAMMTGVILAVARAAGEVAPLMLVGVVKLAPNLPLDMNAPSYTWSANLCTWVSYLRCRFSKTERRGRTFRSCTPLLNVGGVIACVQPDRYGIVRLAKDSRAGYVIDCLFLKRQPYELNKRDPGDEIQCTGSTSQNDLADETPCIDVKTCICITAIAKR